MVSISLPDAFGRNHPIRHKQEAAAAKQSFGVDCSLVEFFFVDRRS
jgi:hypothetical protein